MLVSPASPAPAKPSLPHLASSPSNCSLRSHPPTLSSAEPATTATDTTTNNDGTSFVLGTPTSPASLSPVARRAEEAAHAATPLSAWRLAELGHAFGRAIPCDEVSVAALQGHLFRNKTRPEASARVAAERAMRERLAREKEARERRRREDRERRAREKHGGEEGRRHRRSRTRRRRRTRPSGRACPPPPDYARTRRRRLRRCTN
jgi:hypothetical protein